jgi:uncharacterized protein YqhQ
MSDIGGQAVIEGVMMRSGNVWTVAVRNPEKDIVVKRENVRKLPKPLKWPLLRGVIALVQSLSIGIKALLYSAEASGHEEEKPSSLSLFFTVSLAVLIGIGLFLLFPLYGTKLLGILYQSINESSLMFNLVDGIIRAALTGTSGGYFSITVRNIRLCMHLRPGRSLHLRMWTNTAHFTRGAAQVFCLLS